jgi:hypothetical protein
VAICSRGRKLIDRTCRSLNGKTWEALQREMRYAIMIADEERNIVVIGTWRVQHGRVQ